LQDNNDSDAPLPPANEVTVIVATRGYPDDLPKTPVVVI
jgi:hypothetical protein